MAPARQHGVRIFASPARRTGRPRYYYNTDRGSFYSQPSRAIPRAQRLDVLDLMEIAETRRDFRITSSGEVRFRGQPLTARTGRPRRAWNIKKDKQPFARLRGRRKKKPGEAPPDVASYLAAVAARNPAYTLDNIVVNQEDDGTTSYTGIFVSRSRGTVFAVTTS